MAARLCKSLCSLSSRRIMAVDQGNLSWGSRSFCHSRTLNATESKEVKVSDAKKTESVGEAKDNVPKQTPMDLTPEKYPTTFDRFLLAWANVYPKMEDVPDRVRTTKLMHARDICRVKVAHWMTGILAVLIALQIIMGRQDREARIAAYEEETEKEYQEELKKHQDSKKM